MSQAIVQSTVATSGTINPNQVSEQVYLVNPDGSAFNGQSLKWVPIVTATAIGTAAKTTTSSEPAAGTLVAIQFTNGNSAATPTVAFNGGTARAIKLGGTATAAADITVAAGGVVFFFFDGTDLHQFGVIA